MLSRSLPSSPRPRPLPYFGRKIRDRASKTKISSRQRLRGTRRSSSSPGPGRLKNFVGLGGAFPEVPHRLVVALVGLGRLGGELDLPVRARRFPPCGARCSGGRRSIVRRWSAEWSKLAGLRPSVRGWVGRFQPTRYCHQRRVGESAWYRRLVHRDGLDRGHRPERAVGERPGGARQERAVAGLVRVAVHGVRGDRVDVPQPPDWGAGVYLAPPGTALTAATIAPGRANWHPPPYMDDMDAA